MIDRLKDIHTHNLHSSDGIVSLEPKDFFHIRPEGHYSVGIHPWRADIATEEDWYALQKLAEKDEVLMIGECGLDRLCQVPFDIQMSWFRKQIELSESMKMPLLIHCVKSAGDVIGLKKEYKPRQNWIIHGFRGKPQLASELLRHGMFMSVGEKFNTDVLETIPRDRLLVETDESTLSIDEISRRVGDHIEAWELFSPRNY